MCFLCSLQLFVFLITFCVPYNFFSNIIRRIQRDTMTNVHRSSCKYPLFLSDFSITWIFSTDFLKIHIQFHKNPSSWKPSCFMRTDEQTDRQTWRNIFFFAILRTRVKAFTLQSILTVSTHYLYTRRQPTPTNYNAWQNSSFTSVPQFTNTEMLYMNCEYMRNFCVLSGSVTQDIAFWKYWVVKDIWQKCSFLYYALFRGSNNESTFPRLMQSIGRRWRSRKRITNLFSVID
jgi:hypothetical protein